jgi:hypothetical protein
MDAGRALESLASKRDRSQLADRPIRLRRRRSKRAQRQPAAGQDTSNNDKPDATFARIPARGDADVILSAPLAGPFDKTVEGMRFIDVALPAGPKDRDLLACWALIETSAGGITVECYLRPVRCRRGGAGDRGLAPPLRSSPPAPGGAVSGPRSAREDLRARPARGHRQSALRWYEEIGGLPAWTEPPAATAPTPTRRVAPAPPGTVQISWPSAFIPGGHVRWAGSVAAGGQIR